MAFMAFAGLANASEQLNVVDDIGRSVSLQAPAQRIIALSPHLTELLFAAGAGEKIVAAVEYSNHPQAANSLPRVGRHDRFDVEAILAYGPDLIVAWDSGNPPTPLERLETFGIPIFRSEPAGLDAIGDNLRRLGRLAGTDAIANQAANAFDVRLQSLRATYGDRTPVTVFYQVWNEPLFTIGGKHVISEVIDLCGGSNAFGNLPGLAPRIDVEAVIKVNPQLIVASGMGESRPEWLDTWKAWPGLSAVKNSQLGHVPPDILQRHTPRLLDGAEQLCVLIDNTRNNFLQQD